jgi:hypothetical protein
MHCMLYGTRDPGITQSRAIWAEHMRILAVTSYVVDSHMQPAQCVWEGEREPQRGYCIRRPYGIWPYGLVALRENKCALRYIAQNHNCQVKFFARIIYSVPGSLLINLATMQNIIQSVDHDY